MSSPRSSRLPYADAETPHQMYADCCAAGANLRVPLPREQVTLETGRRHVVSTSFQVSEDAARLAGSLHLHLN